MDSQSFAKKITTLRKQGNLTQEDLANKLGVSNKTISKWETGKGFPDISLLPYIANVFDTTIDNLLCYDGKINNSVSTNKSNTRSFTILFKKISLCTIGIMLFQSLLWAFICIFFDEDNLSKLSETFLNIITYINIFIFLIAPIIGGISSIIGIVFGCKEKNSRTTILSICTLIITIILPILFTFLGTALSIAY